MSTAERVPLPDNLRGLLLLLVGAGHGLEPLLGQSATARALYSALYLFHVPAFAALSGMLTRPAWPTAQALRSLLQPLLLYQCAYVAVDVLWLGHAFTWQWAWQPYWVLWFLLSLATWRLLLPLLLKLRWPLAWGVALALGAGMVESVGYPLSLSRTAVFLPCFLAGHLAPDSLRAWLRTGPGRALGAAAFALLAAWAFAVATGRLPSLDTRLLYGSTSYAALGLGPADGLLQRTLVLIAAWVLTGAAWSWTPKRRGPLTRLGAASLHPYAAHGLLLRLSPLQPWLVPLPALLQPLAGMSAGVLAVVLPGARALLPRGATARARDR
jgi:fucose 4-O-acetylase-like acetyltransferase